MLGYSQEAVNIILGGDGGGMGEKFRRPSPERGQSPLLPALAATGLGGAGVYGQCKADWGLGQWFSFSGLPPILQ